MNDDLSQPVQNLREVAALGLLLSVHHLGDRKDGVRIVAGQAWNCVSGQAP